MTLRLAALLKMDDVADGIMDYLISIESKSVSKRAVGFDLYLLLRGT